MSRSTPGSAAGGGKSRKRPSPRKYGAIVFDTPSDPNDPPRFRAFFEKLTGNVDTDKLLAASPGEVLNLPGYEGGQGRVARGDRTPGLSQNRA
jgi:hypothetical protein